MKKNKIIISVFSVISLVFSSFASVTIANDVDPMINPPEVVETLAIGDSIVVEKKVTTPEIPPVIDVCLLEDETGSFWNDIANLKTAAPAIYDDIVTVSPDAQFAVTGFRDYPEPEYKYGNSGDHVYRLLRSMTSDRDLWLAGINALTAGGGWDEPEAQYDAIVAATGPGTFNDPTLGEQGNCGWRNQDLNPGVQRVLIVTTDASFHLPGPDSSDDLKKPHVNDEASTITALQAQNITVIGLEAPNYLGEDPGDELDNLAAATGGSVQSLSPDGSNIAQAILNGLEEVRTDVWFETDCDVGLTVTLDPLVHYDVPGNTILTFDETIAVADDPSLGEQILKCTVTFIANEHPKEGAPIGTQEIEIYVPDNTPPEISCIETVNPSGKNIPPAGSTTLPGSKGGQNEDGFYQLVAEDAVDLNVMIYVKDEESGTIFGPYASGTNVKYTEMESEPRVKPWGSAKSFVEWHIFGNGDMVIYTVDSAGNESYASCLVPPFPK